MTGGGEDDTGFRKGVESVKRMRCNSCERELMPGNGLRLRDYDEGEGVVIIAYCDRECLMNKCGGVRGRLEIEEKVEECERKEKRPEEDYVVVDRYVNPYSYYKQACKWFLGEVDDL